MIYEHKKNIKLSITPKWAHIFFITCCWWHGEQFTYKAGRQWDGTEMEARIRGAKFVQLLLAQHCDEILAFDVIRGDFYCFPSAEANLSQQGATYPITFSRLIARNSRLIVPNKFITCIKIASRAEKPPWSDWQSLARVGVATLSRINIINHSLLSYIYGALFGLLYFNLYFRFLPAPLRESTSLMPTKNTNNTLSWSK